MAASLRDRARAGETAPGQRPAMPLGPDDEPWVDSAQDAPSDPAPVTAPAVPITTRLADRLVRLAYRLHVPGDFLASPFGRRPRARVVATVENPLAGDRAAGIALRLGQFLVCGARFAFDAVDMRGSRALPPPLARMVHGFTWLADLAATGSGSGTGAEATAIAERLLTAWLDANPAPPRRVPARSGANSAWSVELCGLRVLNWLVHAPLVLASLNPALRTRAMASLQAQADWLDRQAPRAGDTLGAVAGWCGVVATGLLLPAGRPRQLHGERGLMRALAAMVDEDGGVLSRSPLAQAEAIALLSRLSACYRALRHEPPEAIGAMLAQLVPPLLAVRHADGALGSWQGALPMAADALEALVAASRVRARPLRSARAWGYQHVAARDSVLQFDAAPPPLPRHARHGCASTLAFEFSHQGQRLVVNCGGAAAAGALVPADWEEGLRATVAHSTLTLDDRNSSAVLPAGAIGRGVAEVDVERTVVPAQAGHPGSGSLRLEACHDGYAARYGLVHSRALTLADDGRSLAGEDRLVPVRRLGRMGGDLVGRLRGKGRQATVAGRFHLGPEVEVYLSDDGQGAGLALPDGAYWLFRAAGMPVRVEESIWVDAGGRPLDTRQLVLHRPCVPEGVTLDWSFKRLG